MPYSVIVLMNKRWTTNTQKRSYLPFYRIRAAGVRYLPSDLVGVQFWHALWPWLFAKVRRDEQSQILVWSCCGGTATDLTRDAMFRHHHRHQFSGNHELCSAFYTNNPLLYVSHYSEIIVAAGTSQESSLICSYKHNYMGRAEPDVRPPGAASPNRKSM